MSAAVVLAAFAAAAATALLLPPRPRAVARSAKPQVDRSQQAPLLRARPLLAPLAGAGAWAFFGGMLGLVAGVLAAVLTWRVLGRVESPAAVLRRERLDDELPAAVDLVVAALESGLSVVDALDLVGAALPGPVREELSWPVSRLRLGSDPGEVWSDLSSHPQLGPLGRAFRRAHASGASVVQAGRTLAEELRALRVARGEVVARAVSTRAALPMGVCFLPAFLLLGIIPLVAAMLLAFDLT